MGFDVRLEQLRAIRNREKEREERERREEGEAEKDDEEQGRLYSEVSPLRATPSTSHRRNNIEDEMNLSLIHI